jgi:hypothetical protein
MTSPELEVSGTPSNELGHDVAHLDRAAADPLDDPRPPEGAGVVRRPVGHLRTGRKAAPVVARQQNEGERSAERGGGESDDAFHGSGEGPIKSGRAGGRDRVDCVADGGPICHEG